MATNFMWVLPQDCMITAKSLDGNVDVVVTVNAYRSISDGTNSTKTPVCLGLTPPAEGFIPYQELTQEDVEGWLDAGLPVDEIDAQLVVQLDDIINPKTVVLPNPF